jgi:hypothetical protein
VGEGSQKNNSNLTPFQPRFRVNSLQAGARLEDSKCYNCNYSGLIFTCDTPKERKMCLRNAYIMRENFVSSVESVDHFLLALYPSRKPEAVVSEFEE